MKSIILFGAQTKLTNSHKCVSHRAGPKEMQQPHYYVRMKTVNADCGQAMNLAKSYILEGEMLLNTVEIETDQPSHL